MATTSDTTEWAGGVTDRFRATLSPEEIHKKYPQFRILIIGKANTSKTTVLWKVCNVSSGVKPIVHDCKENLIEYKNKKVYLNESRIKLVARKI